MSGFPYDTGGSVPMPPSQGPMAAFESAMEAIEFRRRIRYVPVRTLAHAQLIHDRYRAASTAAVRVPAKASNRIRLRRFRLLDYTRRRWLDVPDRLAARILVP